MLMFGPERREAGRSVSQVCSSRGRQALLLEPHLAKEQEQVVNRAAASLPLRYSLSQPNWPVAPRQVVRVGHSVFALCTYSGAMRAGGFHLYSVVVDRAGLSLVPSGALPPGIGSSPLAAGGPDGLYLLDFTDAALDIHKRSPEGGWSALESYGAVPRGREGGIAVVDGTRRELWLVGSVGKGEAEQEGSKLALHCYSIASKQWRAVQATGPGPEGAQLLAASAKRGKLLALSKSGDLLQAHSLDAGTLTWSMLDTIAIPTLAACSTPYEPMVSEFQGGRSWLVVLEGGDRTLHHQVFAFSDRRWRAEDLTPSRPNVTHLHVLLPGIPESPSLLGANYARACKAAAAKSGACHPAPWHDYATGRVREPAQAPAPAVRAGASAAMKPRAVDVAHFISPRTEMHRILWTEWPLESSQVADPAAPPCVTAPAGLGYDLRMAQAARRGLLRACAADAVLRIQVNGDAPGTGIPCSAGVLAGQSAFVSGLFTDIGPVDANPGQAAVDFPLGLEATAKLSLRDLLRCVRGDSHVGQLPRSNLPELLRVADRLDFQGIRREVVAVLGCTQPSPDMLAPLLEMAEARQHDAELQQLKEMYMDALTLLLLRGDGDAARESWLGWTLRGFAAGIHCVLERCWKLLEEDTYVLKTNADLAALDSADAALLAERQPEVLHAALAAYFVHQQERLADWEARLRARTAKPKGAFASAAAPPAQAAALVEPAQDVDTLREQCRGVLLRLQSREGMMSKLEREQRLGAEVQRVAKRQRRELAGVKALVTGMASEIVMYTAERDRFLPHNHKDYDLGI